LKFKQLPAKKLKVLMALFFGTGIFGIILGNNLTGLGEPNTMFTIMGVVNLFLGALVGWIFLTREPRDSRKKRKK
jgi:TM2 domain-containing membrane protein YozV